MKLKKVLELQWQHVLIEDKENSECRQQYHVQCLYILHTDYKSLATYATDTKYLS
mgnify:CR=1 FL=1